MTGTLASQLKKSPTQVANEGEKVFEKEEHQLIYRTFLDTLKNPEKKIQGRIAEIQKEMDKKELSEQQTQKLKALHAQLQRLQNNENEILSFMLKYSKEIFSSIDQEKTRVLSKENFCQFLLSVFEKIREKNSAREGKLNNDEIKQVVNDCIADIREIEAKDSLKKLIGLPFGIKIDPKNTSGSFWDGAKEKIPFLGKGKKEEDKPPLSDEEMATTFLRKSLFPIIVLTTAILLGGLSGPVSVLGLFSIPHVIVIGLAVFGLATAEYKAVKSLFSNNKEGTVYNPLSNDKEIKNWDDRIIDGIDKILEAQGNGVGNGEQSTVTTAQELLTQGNKKSAPLEQVIVTQPSKNESLNRT